MHHVYIMLITLAMLTASPVWAQEDPAEETSPCVAELIFHCVEQLDGGGAIGHFGYNLQCPDDAGPAAELYVDIGDDNRFSPDRQDRGQPKIFLPGEHVDEFTVDYTLEEVKAGSAIHWSVLGHTVTVDFSKSKDEFLDCNKLP